MSRVGLSRVGSTRAGVTVIAVSSDVTDANALVESSDVTLEVTTSPQISDGVAVSIPASEEGITVASPVLVASVASVESAETTPLDTISGVVTISGTGVQGAKIYVINQENDSIEATATTDSNGNYSVTVPALPLYHVTVQYDDGSEKYNAPSKPYVK
jgi:hypothetical protein